MAPLNPQNPKVKQLIKQRDRVAKERAAQAELPDDTIDGEVTQPTTFPTADSIKSAVDDGDVVTSGALPAGDLNSKSNNIPPVQTVLGAVPEKGTPAETGNAEFGVGVESSSNGSAPKVPAPTWLKDAQVPGADSFSEGHMPTQEEAEEILAPVNTTDEHNAQIETDPDADTKVSDPTLGQDKNPTEVTTTEVVDGKEADRKTARNQEEAGKPSEDVTEPDESAKK